MNNFDKKFLFAFDSYFLKITVNCGKEDMLILNRCSFQKKILSNLTCVLIYSLTTCVLEDGSEKSKKLHY